MRSSFAWSFVGAIWGGGIGLIFGAFPSAAIVFVLLDGFNSGSTDDTRAMFGGFWGAIMLLTSLLGVLSGYLLSRERSMRDEGNPLNHIE